MPKKVKSKPKRKFFRSSGRGKPYAKKVGKGKALTEALETELDNHATIKAKLADIERRKSEARDRETYHDLRMTYLGGETTCPRVNA